jgi:Uri superfamily endonuclease
LEIRPRTPAPHALKGSEGSKLKKQGAYVLYLDVRLPLTLTVGSLGRFFIPAGRYAYVGSARTGIAGRIARHRRLAEQKAGKIHWHIDYLLMHSHIQWAGDVMMEDGVECDISKQIASKKGVTVPVPGFGASDCRSECKAHLYRLPGMARYLLTQNLKLKE